MVLTTPLNSVLIAMEYFRGTMFVVDVYNRCCATSADSFVWSGRKNVNRLKMSITDIMYIYVSPSIVAGMLAMLTKST